MITVPRVHEVRTPFPYQLSSVDGFTDGLSVLCDYSAANCLARDRAVSTPRTSMKAHSPGTSACSRAITGISYAACPSNQPICALTMSVTQPTAAAIEATIRWSMAGDTPRMRGQAERRLRHT